MSMDQVLKKVELGCGRYKTNGYIGIDRFPLKNVDIVADLNKPFPLEDSSVDVLYMCHSLEHFENFQATIAEIYRVCKHGAIVQIIVPYHFSTLNRANIYHLNHLTEDTFRFFTSFPVTYALDPEEWYVPRQPYWGLAGSDNSKNAIQLEVLNMEFFYFKDYLDLPTEYKRAARRSFNNVCDQIYYELFVNKRGTPLSQPEFVTEKARAKSLEPPIIQTLRVRDATTAPGHSIYHTILEQSQEIETLKQQVAHLTNLMETLSSQIKA